MLAHFLTSPNYRVETVDADIAETAGELRAVGGLTLPDAIVIATAQLRGASFVVTQDEKLRGKHLAVPVLAPDAVT
jgi:predicted nucleic acid-binding protein